MKSRLKGKEEGRNWHGKLKKERGRKNRAANGRILQSKMGTLGTKKDVDECTSFGPRKKKDGRDPGGAGKKGGTEETRTHQVKGRQRERRKEGDRAGKRLSISQTPKEKDQQYFYYEERGV